MGEDENKTTQTTQTNPFDYNNARFDIAGVGSLSTASLYNVMYDPKNQDKYLTWVEQTKGSRARKKEEEYIDQLMDAVYKGHIRGTGSNTKTVYDASYRATDPKRKDIKSDKYLQWILEGVKNNPTFEYGSWKPKPVEKPKENPKFTNETISDLFGTLGIYENGKLDLIDHEKIDTDAKHGHITGFNGRKEKIKSYFQQADARIRTKNPAVEGQDPTYTYNYDFIDDVNSRFKNSAEYEDAYDAIQQADSEEDFRNALSRFGIEDEEDWVRLKNEHEAPTPPPPAKQKTAVETAREAAAKQAQAQADAIEILNLRWPAERQRLAANFASQQAVQNWVSPFIKETAEDVPWYVERDGETGRDVHLRDQNYANYLKGLQLNGEDLINASIEGFTLNPELLYDYLNHMFVYNNDKKTTKDGLVWNPNLVNFDLGTYYTFDPGVGKLYLNSIHDAPQEIYDYIYGTLESRFKQNNARLVANGQNSEKKLNGGKLTQLKALRNGGVVKMYHGYSFDKVMTQEEWLASQKEANKKKKKQERDARAADPTIEDPDWIKWIDRGSGMADLLGLAASFVPVYGNAASGVLGILGTSGTLVADIARDGVQGKDFTKFGANLGADVVGLIPGIGVAAKAKKVAKVLTSIASTVNLGAQCKDVIAKLQGNDWDFSSLNENDWNDLIQGVAPFLVGARSWKGDADLNKLLKEADVRGVKSEKALEDIRALKQGARRDAGVSLRQQQAAQRLSTSNKQQQVASNLWGNAQPVTEAGPHLRVVTPAAEEVAENKPSFVGKWVGKGVKAVKKGWKELDKLRQEIQDATLDRNGGKIEQLRVLRKGGILKADNGAQLERFKQYKLSLGKSVEGLDATNMEQDTDWVNFMKPEMQAIFNNYNDGNPFTSNVNDLKYKKVNTGLYNAAQLATVISGNNSTREYGDAIMDNVVLKSQTHLDRENLVNNLAGYQKIDNAMGEGINALQQFGTSDPSSYKQGVLDLYKSKMNATSQLATEDATNLQNTIQNNIKIGNEESQLNQQAHYENQKAIAAANVAVAGINKSVDQANTNAIKNGIVQERTDKLADVKDYNAGVQQIFEGSNNQILQQRLSELQTKYEIKTTDTPEQKAAKEYLYNLEYENLTKQYAGAGVDALKNFYGLNTKQNTPTPIVKPESTHSVKKGGKLDREVKRDIENSRFLSKQLIQQMKSKDKGFDRLSKVTYKAILKSLGLE